MACLLVLVVGAAVLTVNNAAYTALNLDAHAHCWPRQFPGKFNIPFLFFLLVLLDPFRLHPGSWRKLPGRRRRGLLARGPPQRSHAGVRPGAPAPWCWSSQKTFIILFYGLN